MPAITGVLADRLIIEVSHGSLRDDVELGGSRAIALHHTNIRDRAAALLDLYQRAGAVGLHQRRDDCSVILFDGPHRRLVLCRDRLGLQPWYYFEHEGGFYFGSLIRTLLRAARRPGRPNRPALATALIAGGAPAPGTSYLDGVHAVPPGCTLIHESGKSRVLHAAELTGSAAGADFRDLFAAAVQSRIDHARPTGVLVSGGLDSASILSVAPALTFGITYGLQDGSRADESKYIELLRAAGRQIERVDFYPAADLASIEADIRYTELPVMDHVASTTQRAAQHARRLGAEVLLLGTWGDQVLSPFPPAHLRRVPPWRLLALARKARLFRNSLRDVETQFILRALIRQSVHERVPAILLRARRRTGQRSTVFDRLLDYLPPPPSTTVAANYADAVRAGTLSPDQTQAIEAVRKWGWGNGLDVRLPFLDVDLLRLLLGLPDEQAYRGDSLKPILRDAMRGRVPDELLERGDKGDYTEAINRGRLPVPEIVPALGGLQRLISFQLMSEGAAQKTLARLEKHREIGEADVALAGVLLGLNLWLRIFCEDADGKEG